MKNIILILMLVAFSLVSNAQGKSDRQEMRKKFEAQKVAFITQELDLSPEESQKFWPLFNEMNKKLNDIKKKRMLKRRSLVVESLSDKEILMKCDSMIQAGIDMGLLKKEYFNKFKKILPAKKVLRLLSVERDFQRKLLGKIGCRHRHGQERGRNYQGKD